MNYLVNLLVKEAATTISGLKLSNKNYKTALDLLHDRFGNPQMIITAHMNKLLNLDPVSRLSDVKGLRNLFDLTESQVRSLQALGLEAKNYGPLFIPVLLQKLPAELKLMISRQFGKEAWEVELILKAFKKELEAQEKVCGDHESTNKNRYSGSSLHTTARYRSNNFSCLFCSKNHKPQYRTVVTNSDASDAV